MYTILELNTGPFWKSFWPYGNLDWSTEWNLKAHSALIYTLGLLPLSSPFLWINFPGISLALLINGFIHFYKIKASWMLHQMKHTLTNKLLYQHLLGSTISNQGYASFPINLREVNYKINTKDPIRHICVWGSSGLYLGNHQKDVFVFSLGESVCLCSLKISVFHSTWKTFYLTSLTLNDSEESHAHTIFLVFTL